MLLFYMKYRTPYHLHRRLDRIKHYLTHQAVIWSVCSDYLLFAAYYLANRGYILADTSKCS